MLGLYYDPVLGARYWFEPIKMGRSAKKAYDEKKFIKFVESQIKVYICIA